MYCPVCNSHNVSQCTHCEVWSCGGCKALWHMTDDLEEIEGFEEEKP